MSLFALVLLVGCGDAFNPNEIGKDDAILEEDVDEDPPIIVHTPITGTQNFGSDVAIEATVTDGEEGSGVLFVYLYYKNEIDGSADWNKDILIESSDDSFTGLISGDDHSGGGIDYYLEAVDKAQNGIYSPKDGENDPHHFRIAE